MMKKKIDALCREIKDELRVGLNPKYTLWACWQKPTTIKNISKCEDFMSNQETELLFALKRADKIIGWMAKYIGWMSFQSGGYSDLNDHWLFMAKLRRERKKTSRPSI